MIVPVSRKPEKYIKFFFNILSKAKTFKFKLYISLIHKHPHTNNQLANKTNTARKHKPREINTNSRNGSSKVHFDDSNNKNN